jgi:hypothetical protein
VPFGHAFWNAIPFLSGRSRFVPFAPHSLLFISLHLLFLVSINMGINGIYRSFWESCVLHISGRIFNNDKGLQWILCMAAFAISS